ncbi:hypothetical protein EMN47_14070 [Prolixibacteraceae bacterium JC049]|nr:hypothetical protein [Prolixibacteraceae bacterium JC049]
MIVDNTIKTIFNLDITRADELAVVESPFGAGTMVNIYLFFSSEDEIDYSESWYAKVSVS